MSLVTMVYTSDSSRKKHSICSMLDLPGGGVDIMAVGIVFRDYPVREQEVT